MTTIIIIVVVALVFFVTVCVVTFMVWKREAEMRTDSIRAIEDNLQRLEDRLTVETQPEEQTPLQDDLHEEVCRPVLRASDPAVAGRSRRSRIRSRSRDRRNFADRSAAAGGVATAGTFATDSRNVDNAGCVGDTAADHT